MASGAAGPKARSQRKRARMRALARKWAMEDLRKGAVRKGGGSAVRSER